MIKLKTILTEGFAWERKEGKGLPTLAEVQAEYEAGQTGGSYEAMTDSQLIDATHDAGAEEMIIYGADGDLENRQELIDLLNAEDNVRKSSGAKPDYIDADGDGNEKESMRKAFADSTNYGNYINKARAKSAVSKNVDRVYGHGADGATKLNSPSDVDNYSIWTIKSKPKSDSVNAGFNSATIGKNYPDEISGEYEGNPVVTPGADLYELLKDISLRAIDENDFVDKVADALTDETSNLPHTDEDNLRTWYEKNIGEGFISRLKKNLICAELRK